MLILKSKLGKDEIIALQMYVYKKDLIFPLILSLALLSCAIYMMLSYFIFGVLLLIMSLLVPIFVGYLAVKIYKRTEQSSLDSNSLLTFDFSADSFDVSAKLGEEELSSTSVNFAELTNAVETKKHFFIFISKVRAFVITKQTNEIHNIEGLRKLLKLKLKDNFAVKL